MTANNNSGGGNTTLSVSNVQASAATINGFQVGWSTNLAASSSVDYGTTSSYGSATPVNSSMVTSHQVALSGLTKATTYHYRVNSTDGNGKSASSGDMTFATTNDTTPPTVSITSPAANATIAGAVSVTASATDNVAVASVQFKVDSASTGAAITAAPYTYLLDTTTLSNGNHVLTAVATDTSGNSATSTGVPVKVNNVASSTPSINSLNPTSGAVGTSVTVAGANFGATQGTSTVTFNGTAATPTSWSATIIVAKVPTGTTTGNVIVTVGGVASNGVSFTVNTPVVPSISSLSPTSGFVGSSVTISGANFGATQGSSTVKFNGTTATPTGWGASSIATKVPAGATTGNVVVTVGSAASNGVSFTVQADTTPPSVPTGLGATAISSSQINLSWTASTDNVGVTGYNIYRGGTKIATSPTNSYQDAGLTASTTYSYTVSAFDAAGNTSAQSSSASATTQAASTGGGIPAALGWYQIPNSSIQSLCPSYPEIQGQSGCSAVMSAWSGGLFDTKRNRLIIHGGGHTDYFGNEIYAIDLNANPIAPVLVKDASHGSAVSNVTSCPEAYTDGNPDARHSYSGEVYVANLDIYMTYSGSKSNCGSFTNGLWYFDPNTLAWTQQTTSGSAPNPAQNGSVPQLAYNPTTGKVYEVEANTGILWVFDPSAKTWTNLANVKGCSALNSTAAIDDGRQLYFCIGNGGFNSVNLTAPYTSTALSGTNCGSLKSTNAPGFAYDPVQKLMVGWAGGNTAYLYNPTTDSCTSATYSGGPTTIQSNGTYGRFQYSPADGVFTVANSISTDAYTLRLTASSGTGSGPVISAVSVNSITTTGATVTWTTDVPSTTQVEYGTTTSYGTLTTLNSSLVTSHSQALTGLTLGTLYHYRVHSKNSGGVESISGDNVFSTNSTVDTIPPTISITSPASGATVSGTVTVSATATDNVGVTAVQFFLDGANLGMSLAAAPYSVSWDSTSSTNGTHTLTAQASDAAGNIGNATAVTVTVSNSTSTALQDFQTRCAQAGIIVCQGFDDPAVFTPAKWPASGLYPDGNGVIQGTMDTTISASGAGSLKFTVPSLAGANSSGYWRQLFTSNLAAGPTSATMFSQNSTFYLQFRQRFSIEYLTNNWVTGSGAKTFWKQEIMSNDNSTCGNIELTTVNWNQRRYPTMYSQCGQDGFVVNLNNGDYLEEQGDSSGGGYNCHYQTANNTATSCFIYPADTWVTFYYKVSIGTWGQPNSTIQAWVAVGGGPYAEFVNMQNHTLVEDSTAGADYDMVTLLAYMTGRSASVSAGPTAYTWYDELIVSTQPVAPPNN